MTARPGIRVAMEINRLDCQDQHNRIKEVQQALFHAVRIMDLVSCDRLDRQDALSVTYLASEALNCIANTVAEDATDFMHKLCDNIPEYPAIFDTEDEVKGERNERP